MIDSGKCVKDNETNMQVKDIFQQRHQMMKKKKKEWKTSGNYFSKNAWGWTTTIMDPLNQILSESGLIIRQDSNKQKQHGDLCTTVAVWLFAVRGEIMGPADSHLFHIIVSHLKPSVLFDFTRYPLSKTSVESWKLKVKSQKRKNKTKFLLK